jgi:Fe-S cluster biogenesis protein NfuA
MSMPFSDEDLKEPVSNLIDTKISPMLAKDGGAMKLLGIKNGKVYIQLQGACIGCASSGSTLKYIVEKNLKEFIHYDLEIVNVPLGEEHTVPND